MTMTFDVKKDNPGGFWNKNPNYVKIKCSVCRKSYLQGFNGWSIDPDFYSLQTLSLHEMMRLVMLQFFSTAYVCSERCVNMFILSKM